MDGWGYGLDFFPAPVVRISSRRLCGRQRTKTARCLPGISAVAGAGLGCPETTTRYLIGHGTE